MPENQRSMKSMFTDLGIAYHLWVQSLFIGFYFQSKQKKKSTEIESTIYWRLIKHWNQSKKRIKLTIVISVVCVAIRFRGSTLFEQMFECLTESIGNYIFEWFEILLFRMIETFSVRKIPEKLEIENSIIFNLNEHFSENDSISKWGNNWY